MSVVAAARASAGAPQGGRFVDTLAYEQIEILAGSIVQITLRRAAAMAGQTIRHRIQVIDDRRGVPQRRRGSRYRHRAARSGRSARARAGPADRSPLTDAWAERRFVIGMRSRETLSAAARLLVDYLHERTAEGKVRNPKHN